MNVTCPNCATVYRVDPAKVPEAGVRARCAVCSAVFAVEREGQPGRTPEPAGATAAPAPVPSPSPPRMEPEPVAPAPEPPRPVPPRPQPVGSDQLRAPAWPEPPRSAPPSRPMPAAPPRPATPARAPAPAPAAVPALPATTAPTAPAPASAPPAASARPPAAPAAGARPVNPFLSQDPSLKARRLARALISDMVVYHPAKRQEGLRDGTLKQLFDEEIKKSWEEYADQVGRDVAESTPFFREALNEILAGGRQIF